MFELEVIFGSVGAGSAASKKLFEKLEIPIGYKNSPKREVCKYLE